MIILILERLRIYSLSQQTDITNNITETNTQTSNYIDDNYIKMTK